MVEPTSEAMATAWASKRVAVLEPVREGLWAVGQSIPDPYLAFSICYIIEDANDGIHLVDPGWDNVENLAAIDDALSGLGHARSDVVSTTSTHRHPDHTGLVRHFRARGARVQLGADEAASAERSQGTFPSLAEQAGQLVDWGVPSDRISEFTFDAAGLPLPPALDIDATLESGERLDIPGWNIEVVATPGHTDGHIALVDHDREYLITGDHLLPTSFPGLGMEPGSEANALQMYVESQRRIADFDAFEVLPGHGFRFRDGGARRRASTQHHLRRTREVRVALDRDPNASVWDVASGLTWTAGWENLAGFYRVSALAQTRMHMDYAVSRDKIMLDEDG